MRGLAIAVMELWALAKWLEIMDLSFLCLVIMSNLFDVWQLVEFNQTEVQITNWVLFTEKKSLLKLWRNLLLPLPVLPSIWFLDFFQSPCLSILLTHSYKKAFLCLIFDGANCSYATETSLCTYWFPCLLWHFVSPSFSDIVIEQNQCEEGKHPNKAGKDGNKWLISGQQLHELQIWLLELFHR